MKNSEMTAVLKANGLKKRKPKKFAPFVLAEKLKAEALLDIEGHPIEPEAVEPPKICWSTTAELRYIDSIGSFARWPEQTVRPTTQDLLAGYFEGFKKRVEFDNLDQAAILVHVINRLGSC